MNPDLVSLLTTQLVGIGCRITDAGSSGVRILLGHRLCLVTEVGDLFRTQFIDLNTGNFGHVGPAQISATCSRKHLLPLVKSLMAASEWFGFPETDDSNPESNN